MRVLCHDPILPSIPKRELGGSNTISHKLRKFLTWNRFQEKRIDFGLFQEGMVLARVFKGIAVMRCLTRSSALFAVMVFGFYCPMQESHGQMAGPGIGFRNDLKTPIIVQGVSLVNKMQRRGQPFLVNPGKTVWDNNLPPGTLRIYTIYDANQQRILIQNLPINVQKTDQFFVTRPVPGRAGQVKVEQEPVPQP
jgi:hypothetical protein